MALYIAEDIVSIVCDFNTEVLLFLLNKAQKLGNNQFQVKPDEWVITGDEDLFYMGMEGILSALNFLESCEMLKYEVDINKNITVYLNKGIMDNTLSFSNQEIEDLKNKKQVSVSPDNAYRLGMGDQKVIDFVSKNKKQ